MNRKQLLTLIIVGAILAGAGYLVYKQNKASWQSGGDQMGRELLQDFPLNDVAHIHIQSADQEVNLVKKNNQWQVRERYGYPAKFGQIGDFLRTLWDLKGIQQIAIGESQLGRLELELPGDSSADADAGTLVEFKNAEGKPIRSIVLGKQHFGKSNRPSPYGGDQGFPNGRYLMVLNESQPSGNAWLVSETFSNIEPDPGQWLNKDFLQIKKLRSVSVNPAKEGKGWTLKRETEGGDWKLADQPEGKKLDSSKTSRINNALSYGSFADVASPELSPEETGLDQPVVAELATFDEFRYTLKIGKQNEEDNYYFNVQVHADIPAEKDLPEESDKESSGENGNNGEDGNNEGDSDSSGEGTEAETKEIKAFNENVRSLKEKLEKEQAYQNWTYLVSARTVEPFLNQRQDLFAEEEEDTSAGSETTPTPGTPDSGREPPLPGTDLFPQDESPDETPIPLAPEDADETQETSADQEEADSSETTAVENQQAEDQLAEDAAGNTEQASEPAPEEAESSEPAESDEKPSPAESSKPAEAEPSEAGSSDAEAPDSETESEPETGSEEEQPDSNGGSGDSGDSSSSDNSEGGKSSN